MRRAGCLTRNTDIMLLSTLALKVNIMLMCTLSSSLRVMTRFSVWALKLQYSEHTPELHAGQLSHRCKLIRGWPVSPRRRKLVGRLMLATDGCVIWIFLLRTFNHIILLLNTLSFGVLELWLLEWKVFCHNIQL